MFPQVQALYDEDLAGDGYVSNGSRTAAASALGDSYCSLGWGGKLGKAPDAAIAAGALAGGDTGPGLPPSW